MHIGMEAVGWAVTGIAVTGVILNNHRRHECFYLWLVSNALSAVIHAASGMVALTCRDVIFFALAIHGLAAWRRK